MSNEAVKTTDSIVVPHYVPSALTEGATAALTVVQAFVIDSPEMYEEAGFELAQIKSKLADLEVKRTSVSKPLNDALKAHNEIFRGPREILEQAEKALKKGMLAWQDEVERKQAEERRQAEEHARQQREEEERRAAELRRQSEETLAAAAEAAPADQERILEQAQALETAAESAKESAEMVVARPVFTVAAKAAGTSTRKVWKAEVTDKLALIRHIAAGADQFPELLALIDINDSRLNARAKAMEQHLSLPGVRAYEERSLASRRAA